MNDSPLAPGLIRLPSHHGAAATIHRLETLLTQAGVKIFAQIDFSADAQAAGLTLLPELMLIFGNPKAGTPLMVAQPAAGIDLPLKVLCWDDASGQAWLAYNDPAYIIQRHGLPEAFAKNLSAAIPLIEKACAE